MSGFFFGVRENDFLEGKNSDYVQQQNRSLVLRIIMQNKVISRVDLATATGLKPATISNIVKSLLEAEVIRETSLIEGKNGRKVVGLCVNDKRFCSIVIRITKAYWNIGIYEIYNECLFMNKVFVDADEDIADLTATMTEEIENSLKMVPGYELLGIGFVFQGEMLSSGAEEKDAFAPVAKTRWAEELSRYFKAPVYVDKSVDMATYWNGNSVDSKAKQKDTYIYVQVGYSVECCVMNKGRLMYPATWGGQLSHMVVDVGGRACQCGGDGCLGQYVSVPAVLRRVRELMPEYPDSIVDENTPIREVIHAYLENDPLAVRIYGEVAEYLGILAVNLAGLFAPDEICFGDEIPIGKRAEPFREAIESAYKKRAKALAVEKVRIQILTQERFRKKDITMQGCNQYLFDRLLPKRHAVPKNR